jgi:hypothetical protein
MIKRDLYDELIQHLDFKEITIIIGPRQVGKTTLMQMIFDRLTSQGERCVFFNLDFEADKKYFESQKNLLKKIKLEFGENRGYVFIDEMQRKHDAGLFLKGIYDKNLPYKYIVSGSGSLELKEKIHESLTGRKRLFELNPVSFWEFVNYKTSYRYINTLSEFFHIERETANDLLEEYLNFGGYPRIILESELKEKYRIMNEIFSSYIQRDVAYLLNVDKSDSFSLMIKLLANQVGQLVVYSDLSKNLGISLSALKNYLWYAEKTFIIKRISPFFRNKKKEITKSPVFYFYDLGLRNYTLDLLGNINQPSNYGFLFQNLIINMLQEKFLFSGTAIHFWRTTDKAEVDFVISKGMECIPVEVKYKSLKSPEITRSLRSFINKYDPKIAYIINLNLNTDIMINSTMIKFLSIFDLFEFEI